jgi:hypothetical protein
MKFIKVQHEECAFPTLVAVPSNKLEKEMLQNLKYDLFDPEDNSMSPWHMERIGGEGRTIALANALGWDNVTYNGDDLYPETFEEGFGWNYITAIPSNAETIIAGYRLLGKHRKVAMLLKKIKTLGIQGMVFNMTPGRQQA